MARTKSTANWQASQKRVVQHIEPSSEPSPDPSSPSSNQSSDPSPDPSSPSPDPLPEPTDKIINGNRKRKIDALLDACAVSLDDFVTAFQQKFADTIAHGGHEPADVAIAIDTANKVLRDLKPCVLGVIQSDLEDNACM